jgi:hypothetical protein
MTTVSPLPSVPGHVGVTPTGPSDVPQPLFVGVPANTVTGTGGTDPMGRPIYPALFITDITEDPSQSNRSGDWQYANVWGGAAIPPHDIYGTWKGAIKSSGVITTDSNPGSNMWVLGPGSDAPAAGFPSGEKYGTEVRWNLNGLRVKTVTGPAGTSTVGALASEANSAPLVSGNTYRLQFMVHDGDQNKSGGDVGQACVIYTKP